MIRYAILYFVILITFLALIVGPVIVRNYITSLPKIPLDLLQPTNQNKNDTTTGITGSALVNFGDAGGGGAPAETGAASGGNGNTNTNNDNPAPFGDIGIGRFVRW